ncbi:hypothetical protein BKE38_08855 [Pseudoroseomonas deserti]|uniref:Uncharacterized protein n=1 Tax=Teichococcus deserti TaxID=1817963 RepID=A0A1V2H6C7_9PROT|nr:hypothetical protein [Pseudoroseomonas deserti]ONG55683.1 hypothetical protein BKE38_08855 [Pseudoroseomonas deserti]
MRQSATTADSWNEVWDAYEARSHIAVVPESHDEPATAAGRCAPRRWSRVFAAVMALPVLGALLLAGPARPLAAFAGLVLNHAPLELLAQLPLEPGVQVAAPAASHAAPQGGSASRYMAMLAEELSAGWQDPEALKRVVEARQTPAPLLRDATVVPLDRLRQMQITGLHSARLELAPREGAGSLGLDLAWRDGAWRVVRMAWSS